MSWQLQLYKEIATAMPDSGAITLHGSAGEPSSLDGWSDLDVRLTLPAELSVVDLVPTPVWAVEDVADRTGQVCRMVLADGRRLDLSVTGVGRVVGFAASPDNDFRFIAATAMARLGRGERLISTHLILELWQLCLVESMLLRDRDTGSDVHRTPTVRDAYADEIAGLADGGWEPTPRPNVIERTVNLYARWRNEREPAYVPDWSPLHLLIERGIG